MKSIFKLALLIILLLSIQPCRSQEITNWKPIKKSLTAFLEDGWRIITSNDMQWGEGMASQLIVLFVLEKGGKYVRCEVIDPSANKATSVCLTLN